MGSTTAKVRRIGNSRGILFTKSILDESGVKDTVKITVKNKVIMISAEKEIKKKKWSDFKKPKEKLVLVANKFDETEWTW
jgi:antitoxin MazE